MIKSCQNCGTLILSHGGNHRYCTSCSVEVDKEKNRRWIKNYHRERSHFCANCGKRISNYNGHGRKYCKSCSTIVTKELSRLSSLKYYWRWRDVLPRKLGSSNLLQRRKTDFDEEFKVVRNEMKRFKLNLLYQIYQKSWSF